MRARAPAALTQVKPVARPNNHAAGDVRGNLARVEGAIDPDPQSNATLAFDTTLP